MGENNFKFFPKKSSESPKPSGLAAHLCRLKSRLFSTLYVGLEHFILFAVMFKILSHTKKVEGNIRERIVYKIQENIELGFDMFDYGMTDDPIGPSDHIRTTLDFLDNNIKMLTKLSDKVKKAEKYYLKLI